MPRELPPGRRNFFCLCFLGPWLLFLLQAVDPARGILRPQDSETRQTKSLDGIWKFRISPKYDTDIGFRETWFAKDLSTTRNASDTLFDMPVPSSYNDVTEFKCVRDFVGWVWYQRHFYSPPGWKSGRRVFIRFNSVHYNARVWLNGRLVAHHIGGHLPFEADITTKLKYLSANRITVAVNSTLNGHTIPQGSYKWRKEDEDFPPGYFRVSYPFDFFNYAGIHRPVVMYTVPEKMNIKDIAFTTEKVARDHTSATIKYDIGYFLDISVRKAATLCTVELVDKVGVVVAQSNKCSDRLSIANPKLWWPHLMHPTPGYLYTLYVKIQNHFCGEDVYRLEVGLRTVFVDKEGFKINHKPFYLRGVGTHEDYNIRGRGFDLVSITREFYLMQWLGINSLRTAHYPYAEEFLDFADRNGIAVVGEGAATGLHGFGPKLLHNHKQMLQEMIERDKNRACIIMWSLANEPKSSAFKSGPYFEDVVSLARSLDPVRPVSIVTMVPTGFDKAIAHVDAVGLNRYFGWYMDTGHIDLINHQMTNELKHRTDVLHHKPQFITEYGADTIAGFHSHPPTVFSEEYQVESMTENFKAFDKARARGHLSGEMIWNLADFMTAELTHRVIGNRKGIFTRNRQPKAAAFLLRKRYWKMARKDALDIFNYTISNHKYMPKPDFVVFCPKKKSKNVMSAKHEEDEAQDDDREAEEDEDGEEDVMEKVRKVEKNIPGKIKKKPRHKLLSHLLEVMMSFHSIIVANVLFVLAMLYHYVMSHFEEKDKKQV